MITAGTVILFSWFNYTTYFATNNHHNTSGWSIIQDECAACSQSQYVLDWGLDQGLDQAFSIHEAGA